jgi:hypothetical protein
MSPLHTLLQHVVEDRLDRREAGTAADEHDGARFVHNHRQVSERQLNIQRFPRHQFRHTHAQLPARHASGVQHDAVTLVRRIRHGIATRASVFHQYLHVVPGIKLRSLPCQSVQLENGHIGRCELVAVHLVGESLERGRVQPLPESGRSTASVTGSHTQYNIRSGSQVSLRIVAPLRPWPSPDAMLPTQLPQTPLPQE